MTDYEHRYLHDPVFHARVAVGAGAIMRRWQSESKLNQGPTDAAWSEAKLLAFAVVKAVDEAQEGEWNGPADGPPPGLAERLAARSPITPISSTEE